MKVDMRKVSEVAKSNILEVTSIIILNCLLFYLTIVLIYMHKFMYDVFCTCILI